MSKLFENEEEKRKFLEIKPDDDEHIRAMKTELLFVMDMTPEERRAFYAAESVRREENHLQWMVDSMKQDDEFIAMAMGKAKKLMADIRDFGHQDDWMTQAELWTEIAQGTKANRYTIADIRKQRETIWQLKRILSNLRKTSTSTEQSKSSSPSKT